MLRDIVLIIMGLSLALLIPSFSIAALTMSDQLSDVRPSANSNHIINWTVADAGGIAEGERFDVDFNASFDNSTIAVSDIDLLDDLSQLTLSNNCSGVEQVGVTITGGGSIRFDICPGDGGAIATGSVVEIRIGTNATGGVNQIINPSLIGNYGVVLNGLLGYSDSDTVDIVIIDGVTVSASVPSQSGNLSVAGHASPGALVYFLESGSLLGTNLADNSSYFDETLAGLSDGIHSISVYAMDIDTNLTRTITFSVNVIPASTTVVTGLLLPPTVKIDSTSIVRPRNLILSGMGRNNAGSTIQVVITGSGDSLNLSVSVDSLGRWSINVNPKLHLGIKNVYAINLDGVGGISESSSTLAYEVLLSADLNADNLVDLVDFSILMYNYDTSSPENVLADINDDSSVNITDFSVMMYYWTES